MAEKNNSILEMERIVFLTNSFCKEKKLTIDEGIGYIMEECGYKKSNYIPSIYKGDDLFGLAQSSLRYMRKHSIRPEPFIHRFFEIYQKCMVEGYTYDIGQSTLKIIGGDL